MPSLPTDVRNAALEAGLEAAFIANDERELSYTTEELIEAAVQGALDYLESTRTIDVKHA